MLKSILKKFLKEFVAVLAFHSAFFAINAEKLILLEPQFSTELILSRLVVNQNNNHNAVVHLYLDLGLCIVPNKTTEIKIPYV